MDQAVPTKRILHIDSDVFMTGVYEKRFRSEGYDMRVINDASGDIVSRVFEINPDLILLSVFMENRTFWEILRLLKADSRTENIPIFMLTSQGQSQDVHTSIELGAKDHLIISDILPTQVAEWVHTYLQDPTGYTPIYPKYLKSKTFWVLFLEILDDMQGYFLYTLPYNVRDLHWWWGIFKNILFFLLIAWIFIMGV